jgi:transcriptional regulator with XRE-family HTH domain
MNLPAEILARRDVEDRAAKLGVQRAALTAKTNENTAAVKLLLPAALAAGVPMETIAKLTGVSRQTLHQWRNDEGAEAR